MALFTDNMTIYIENPKESKGKTPRLGEFITFTGYRPTFKKNQSCLYASNQQLETKIKSTILFTN